MAQPIIQTSFNAGEWAPALNARVDLAKYHSGAALLRNFFVDYRGGATTRPGTRYVLTSVNNGASPPRLIPFQASFTVAYMLEFGVTSGTGYVRFYQNGAVILSGGVPYSIASPYASSELAQLKFVQNVNKMIITHPNHPPYELILISVTNWTLTPITFGATIAAPIFSSATTTLGGGTVNYAYVATSVDANGQESAPSTFATIINSADIRSTQGTNTLVWTAVPGAQSYNVYRAIPRYTFAVPAGSDFGFVGNVTGTTFYDSDINIDFSQGPPIELNPFFGSGVQSIVVTNIGAYTGTAPTPTFTGGGGSGAAAIATIQATAETIVGSGGFSIYHVGDTITLSNGVIIQVTADDQGGAGGRITGAVIINGGSISSGSAIPSNPVPQISTSGIGVGASFNLTWTLASIGITSPGTGYSTPPTVGGISSGGGAATATLGSPSAGNPTVPAIFQQRLGLLGPVSSPQQVNFSSTGGFYDFNIHSPIEADDAIQGTLTSGQLNTIKSAITMPQGLIVFSDKQAFLLNGGSPGSAISPLPGSFVANSHSYNGASDVPPIIANDNILYVQSKGSIVRDLVFNYYTQVYTGADISVLSSHLFYGFQIAQWAWAEEPFKVVWALRNDGILLSLTFLKEQELIAWAHSDTQGTFQSIATITESTVVGNVDAIYVVVQRSINGSTVQYIERFIELNYPQDYVSSWQVDAGIGYNGVAATTFTGAQHLAGAVVTGVADGVVINFTMPVSGTFVFGGGGTPGLTGIANASVVTVGLAFTPQLQTLALDLGEPTVQGKRKKITGVTTRVKETLGLSIGRTFDAASQKPMKDLVIGNIGTMTNQLVTGLVTGDARTIIDPLYDVPGQYCIQQSFPYPASILGVIPEIEVGDTAK